VLAIAGLVGARPAWAVGSEHLGSEPFPNGPGYSPDRLALVNLPSRVYWREINGDHQFFYRGDTAALNEALKSFAAVELDRREVVLRPGPGETRTFADQPVPYNWEVHMPGGLVLAIRQRALAKGVEVFPTRPRMTVYVGSGIDLDAIQVPARVRVLDLKDLERRYLDGLNLPLLAAPNVTDMDVLKTAQADRTLIRGQSALALGELGVTAEDAVGTLATLLDDAEVYVRDCTVDALGRLGPLARPALPALRRRFNDADPNHRTQIERAINRIRAQPDVNREREERRLLEAIHVFRERHSRP
jgi:hypothetical protein